MVVGERGTSVLRIAPDLRFLLPPRRRSAAVLEVALDGTSTLVHLVESVGIPRTEFATPLIDGRPAAMEIAPPAGCVVDVLPVQRPQPGWQSGFLLDVGLGSLARRLRLLGLDATYDSDKGDDELLVAAIRTGRILLTQDRGLLRRRALPRGALVRGQGADDQLADVLRRFAPLLSPWTRCPACNAPVSSVDARDVAHLVHAGTRETVAEFGRCEGCGKVYWRGAHALALSARIERAREVVRGVHRSAS